MEFKQLVTEILKTSSDYTSSGTLDLNITLEQGTHKLVLFMSNYRVYGTITANDITINGYTLNTDVDLADGRGTKQKSVEITVDSATTLTVTFSFTSTGSTSHAESVVCSICDYM